ncbi:MAG TPA: PP2C family serine/threonine-protein phosphatase [Burkholderiales bacterium]|nr:PP2C family serine/threonine-protein phosphatase [Burkholderiales bacterium]
MKYEIAQESRLGARRINQDRVGHWSTPQSLLAVVADGMGGHANGEVAAQVTVDLLGRAFLQEAKPRLAEPARFLPRLLAAAHAGILLEAQKRGMREAPRTVVVACVVQDGHAHWAHTGDCRLYLFRKGRIHARTRDHSVVQQLVDEGRIREEAVASHPDRNRLLQCLGGIHAPRIDVGSERLAMDDILLLCSDGLWGPLTQRQLLHSLLNRPLGGAIPDLADLAETRAGSECDNTSAVALRWQEEQVRGDDEGPRTVPYDELPTDVQDLTATDLEFLRMSDEDVEKAIDEIKAKLRKNQPQRP